jgi:His-Xaa-Ser system protein HxsD
VSSGKTPDAVEIELDAAVYRLEAVKKAAYRFGDRCVVTIDTMKPGTVRATLNPKAETDVAELAGEFKNEVLDQELREVVAKETEVIRNLLLAQAFSKTALLDPAGDAADFREDPLGIRPPDER